MEVRTCWVFIITAYEYLGEISNTLPLSRRENLLLHFLLYESISIGVVDIIFDCCILYLCILHDWWNRSCTYMTSSYISSHGIPYWLSWIQEGGIHDWCSYIHCSKKKRSECRDSKENKCESSWKRTEKKRCKSKVIHNNKNHDWKWIHSV